MKFSVLSVALIVLGGLVTLAFLGLGIAIYADTLIDWWLPVAVGVGLGAIAFVVAKAGAFSLAGSVWYCRAAVFLMAGSFGYFGFLGLNYLMADDSTSHTENAVIVHKYIEERPQTRRIARRVHNTGRKVTTYYLELAFESGSHKELAVSREQYYRVRTGSTLVYEVRRGGLGFPVIKRQPKGKVIPEAAD